MHPRQRLASGARRIGRSLPPGLRGRVGRATRRLRRNRGPLVSVVVAISDEETTRIAEGLESAIRQSHRDLEVVVVPYGAHRKVLRTARRFAEQDWRVRLLDASADDRATARNLGASASKGTYLAFLGGGDDLPTRGIEQLVASLEASGSEFAVGATEHPEGVAGTVRVPLDAVHRRVATATTLAATPVAVNDAGLGNRLFRRAFWDRHLRLEPGPAEQTAVALRAYAVAERFDLLREVTYVASGRRLGSAIGSMRDLLSGLDDWLEEHERGWQIVSGIDNPEVSQAWLRGVLDVQVQPYLDDAERATPEQWRKLRHSVDRIMDTATSVEWSWLRVLSRVKLWLVSHDERTRLEELVASRWFERRAWPTRVEDGRVYAELPGFRDPDLDIPDQFFEMHEVETPLHTTLRALRWEGDALVLDLQAQIRYVGMSEPPTVLAELVCGEERRPLAVELRRDPGANEGKGSSRYQDYSFGALRLRLDPELLAALPDTGPRWQVELTMATQGVQRSGAIDAIDERGCAGMLGTGLHAPHRFGEHLVGPARGRPHPFVIAVTPAVGPVLRSVRVSGRRVSGDLEADADRFVSLVVTRGERRLSVALTEGRSWTVTIPSGPPPGAAWGLSAVREDGSEAPIGWPSDPAYWLGVGEGDLVARRTGRGTVELREAAASFVVESARHQDGAVLVTGRWLGRPLPPHTNARLALVGPRVTVVGEPLSAPDGKGTVTTSIPTTCDEWGLGARPAPVGRYWFRLQAGTRRRSAGRVLYDDASLHDLLTWRLDERYRLRGIRDGRAAGLFFAPPLREDEVGPFARHRLQQWCTSGEIPIDPNAAYFQSYVGASATDSQLAIHEELRRRDTGLTTYWGVWDHSASTPEGAIPVVIGSQEWFRVLGGSRFLVMNIDFDRWFAPNPGQRVLQTFHGYPAKSMGIRLWEAKGYTPRRIRAELGRTRDDWDLILTPAPEMDQYYRREYAYDGEIHSAGYPRDDVLVSPEASRIREETRSRLGIGPGQKVVLYAPTWRDDLATSWRSAEMVRHLDVETASERLGPEYVFLMRGHRFHARAGERSRGSSRLIDVTDYPEINHLILAADAAVLDYSSLRFDFALTGNPMVFLVPDLKAYTGGVRGFLYDFADSAPGPLLDTADEVVDRLRDLPALRKECAEPLERFNATYNYLQDGHAAERVVDAFFGSV